MSKKLKFSVKPNGLYCCGSCSLRISREEFLIHLQEHIWDNRKCHISAKCNHEFQAEAPPLQCNVVKQIVLGLDRHLNKMRGLDHDQNNVDRIPPQAVQQDPLHTERGVTRSSEQGILSANQTSSNNSNLLSSTETQPKQNKFDNSVLPTPDIAQPTKEPTNSATNIKVLSKDKNYPEKTESYLMNDKLTLLEPIQTSTPKPNLNNKADQNNTQFSKASDAEPNNNTPAFNEQRKRQPHAKTGSDEIDISGDRDGKEKCNPGLLPPENSLSANMVLLSNNISENQTTSHPSQNVQKNAQKQLNNTKERLSTVTSSHLPTSICTDSEFESQASQLETSPEFQAVVKPTENIHVIQSTKGHASKLDKSASHCSHDVSAEVDNESPKQSSLPSSEKTMGKIISRRTSLVSVQSFNEDTSSTHGDTGSFVSDLEGSVSSQLKNAYLQDWPKKFYLCSAAGCCFQTNKSLRFEAHLKTHALPPNGFQCIYCNERKNSGNDLIMHMNSRHSSSQEMQVFHCNFSNCKYYASQSSDFLIHTKVFHQGAYSFSCYYCKNKFMSANDLTKHMQAFFLKLIVCGYCGLVSDGRKEIQSHVKQDHDSCDVKVKSHIMCKLYKQAKENKRKINEEIISSGEESSAEADQDHLENESDHTEKSNDNENSVLPEAEMPHVRYKCFACEYTSTASLDVENHYRREHNRQKFCCGYCALECDNYRKIQDHLEEAHNNVPPKFKKRYPKIEFIHTPQETLNSTLTILTPKREVNSETGIINETAKEKTQKQSSTSTQDHQAAFDSKEKSASSTKESLDTENNKPINVEQAFSPKTEDTSTSPINRSKYMKELYVCEVCGRKTQTFGGMKKHCLTKHPKTPTSFHKIEEETHPQSVRLQLQDVNYTPDKKRNNKQNVRDSSTKKISATVNSKNLLSFVRKNADVQKIINEITTSKSHDGGLYICTLCSQGFDHLNGVKEHLVKDHKHKLHYCALCDYHAIRRDYVIRHLKVHMNGPVARRTGKITPKTPKTVKTPHVVHEEDIKKKNEFEKAKRECKLLTNKSVFICSKCKKQFQNKSDNLDRHISAHIGYLPFRCSVCKYGTLKHADCKRHIQDKHRKGYTTTLVNAIKPENKENELQQMQNQVTTSTEYEWVCALVYQDCTFRTEDRDAMHSHLAEHSGFRPYLCTECDVKALTCEDITRHIEDTHAEELQGNDLNQFIQRDQNSQLQAKLRNELDQCAQQKNIEKVSDEKENLAMENTQSEVSDIKTDSDVDVGPKNSILNCPLCEFKGSRFKLRPHLMQHYNYKPYHCMHCAEKAICATDLKPHYAEHHGSMQFKVNPVKDENVEKKISEDIGKAAGLGEGVVPSPRQPVPKVTPKANRSDAKTKTPDSKKKVSEKICCDKCSYTCNRKDSMVCHLKKEHYNYKPYQCSACDLMTTIKSTMTNHIQTHTAKSLSAHLVWNKVTEIEDKIEKHFQALKRETKEIVSTPQKKITLRKGFSKYGNKVSTPTKNVLLGASHSTDSESSGESTSSKHSGDSMKCEVKSREDDTAREESDSSVPKMSAKKNKNRTKITDSENEEASTASEDSDDDNVSSDESIKSGPVAPTKKEYQPALHDDQSTKSDDSETKQIKSTSPKKSPLVKKHTKRTDHLGSESEDSENENKRKAVAKKNVTKDTRRKEDKFTSEREDSKRESKQKTLTKKKLNKDARRKSLCAENNNLESKHVRKTDTKKQKNKNVISSSDDDSESDAETHRKTVRPMVFSDSENDAESSGSEVKAKPKKFKHYLNSDSSDEDDERKTDSNQKKMTESSATGTSSKIEVTSIKRRVSGETVNKPGKQKDSKSASHTHKDEKVNTKKTASESAKNDKQIKLESNSGLSSPQRTTSKDTEKSIQEKSKSNKPSVDKNIAQSKVTRKQEGSPNRLEKSRRPLDSGFNKDRSPQKPVGIEKRKTSTDTRQIDSSKTKLLGSTKGASTETKKLNTGIFHIPKMRKKSVSDEDMIQNSPLPQSKPEDPFQNSYNQRTSYNNRPNSSGQVSKSPVKHHAERFKEGKRKNEDHVEQSPRKIPKFEADKVQGGKYKNDDSAERTSEKIPKTDKRLESVERSAKTSKYQPPGKKDTRHETKPSPTMSKKPSGLDTSNKANRIKQEVDRKVVKQSGTTLSEGEITPSDSESPNTLYTETSTGEVNSSPEIGRRTSAEMAYRKQKNRQKYGTAKRSHYRNDQEQRWNRFENRRKERQYSIQGSERKVEIYKRPIGKVSSESEPDSIPHKKTKSSELNREEKITKQTSERRDTQHVKQEVKTEGRLAARPERREYNILESKLRSKEGDKTPTKLGGERRDYDKLESKLRSKEGDKTPTKLGGERRDYDQHESNLRSKEGDKMPTKLGGERRDYGKHESKLRSKEGDKTPTKLAGERRDYDQHESNLRSKGDKMPTKLEGERRDYDRTGSRDSKKQVQEIKLDERKDEKSRPRDSDSREEGNKAVKQEERKHHHSFDDSSNNLADELQVTTDFQPERYVHRVKADGHSEVEAYKKHAGQGRPSDDQVYKHGVWSSRHSHSRQETSVAPLMSKKIPGPRQRKKQLVIMADKTLSSILSQDLLSNKLGLHVIVNNTSVIDNVLTYLPQETDGLIVHVGSFELESKNLNTVIGLFDCLADMLMSRPIQHIAFSSILPRKDIDIRSETHMMNTFLYDMCMRNEWTFIDNSNITDSMVKPLEPWLTYPGKRTMRGNIIKIASGLAGH